MKKLLLLPLALCAVLPAYAGRIIPPNMGLYEIRSVNEPMVEVRPPRASWVRWIRWG